MDSTEKKTRASGPEGALKERMALMFEEGLFSDVTVSLAASASEGGESGREFELHRAVLAHSCEYFRGMLTRDFAEAEQETVKLVVAEGSTVEATGAVLQYLYTSEIDIDGSNVLAVLAAADLLQVASLRSACVDFLSTSLCASNACTILKASRRWG